MPRRAEKGKRRCAAAAAGKERHGGEAATHAGRGGAQERAAARASTTRQPRRTHGGAADQTSRRARPQALAMIGPTAASWEMRPCKIIAIFLASPFPRSSSHQQKLQPARTRCVLIPPRFTRSFLSFIVCAAARPAVRAVSPIVDVSASKAPSAVEGKTRSSRFFVRRTCLAARPVDDSSIERFCMHQLQLACLPVPQGAAVQSLSAW